MLIVRETLTAKPGMASRLARLMRDAWPESKVMTDVTGAFNTVVMETEYDSLSDFDKRMEAYMKDPSVGKKMTGYTDLYQNGHREIFRLW